MDIPDDKAYQKQLQEENTRLSVENVRFKDALVWAYSAMECSRCAAQGALDMLHRFPETEQSQWRIQEVMKAIVHSQNSTMPSQHVISLLLRWEPWSKLMEPQ